MDRRLSTLGAFTIQRFQSSSIEMSELREQVDNLQERVAQLENAKTVLQDQDEQMKKRVQELNDSWVAWSEKVIECIHTAENHSGFLEHHSVVD
jgi:predicted nuclease with TOPRIM domain